MGHSDHSTPGRYRHQLEQQYAEDAARLDQYLTGAQTGAQAAHRTPHRYAVSDPCG
jgi:hypothetical protein